MVVAIAHHAHTSIPDALALSYSDARAVLAALQRLLPAREAEG